MASESSESRDTLQDDGDNLTENDLVDFGKWYFHRSTPYIRIDAMMKKRVRKGKTKRKFFLGNFE